jgi:hypothetical protein
MAKKPDKSHVPPTQFVTKGGWDVMGGYQPSPSVTPSAQRTPKQFIPGQRLNLGLTRRP